MSERRDWSQLTPDEKEAAKDNARALMAKGATRWGTIGRLCGLRSGTALRKALDPDYLEQQKAADRERSKRHRRAAAPAYSFNKTRHQRVQHAERGLAHGRLAAMLATAGRRGALKGILNTPSHAPITLPRVKFLEDA